MPKQRGLMNGKQLLFAQEYLKDRNASQAAVRAGYAKTTASAMSAELLSQPLINDYIQRKLAEIEQNTVLNATEIRRYIHRIMQFCPGDYFRADRGGTWSCTEEEYHQLPREIRMLVEHFELRETVGVDENDNPVLHRRLVVTFISKKEAMSLAAKYGLTEKHSVKADHNINWDDLLMARGKADAAPLGADPVEEKIRGLLPAESCNGAGKNGEQHDEG